jgi:hypothetical protein
MRDLWAADEPSRTPFPSLMRRRSSGQSRAAGLGRKPLRQLRGLPAGRKEMAGGTSTRPAHGDFDQVHEVIDAELA